MVNLVLVQANSLNEVDLDFIAGSDAADKITAAKALVLRGSKKRRNIVPWVRVFSGEEGVVIVQLTDRCAVG